MNKPVSKFPKASLLERAEGLFDLKAALRGVALPPVSLSPDELTKAAPPAPAVAPTPVQVQPDVQVQPPAQPDYQAAPVVPPAAPAATAPILTPRAPNWNGPRQRLDRAVMQEAGFLIPDGPVNSLSEEFRILKRELRARLRNEAKASGVPQTDGHMILISSAHSGDGKTFTAINLAVSLAAETDLEVLLVDADFARPSVVSGLGLVDGPGLMDVLADPNIAIENCIIGTEVPSLSVLPTGHSTNRDSEHLASDRMRAVLARLVTGRPERIIIFDSPPLLAASPGAVLSTLVDETILVVRADRTSEAALRDSAHLLGGCNQVRLVLNGVRFSASGRRFGSYYGKGD